MIQPTGIASPKKIIGYPAFLFLLFLINACSPTAKIQRDWKRIIQKDSALNHAHVGIAIYDQETEKYLFRSNSDRYFMPASNTKIFTLYAALTSLPDSVPTFRYTLTNDTLYVWPNGDPSFLHPDFSLQPAFNFLEQTGKPIAIINKGWGTSAWGPGWSWGDYQEGYMAERNLFPVFGNCIQWFQRKPTQMPEGNLKNTITAHPSHSFPYRIEANTEKSLRVSRKLHENDFTIHPGSDSTDSVEIPFITNGIKTALTLLGKNYSIARRTISPKEVFYSRPADSLYKKMMWESDNFIAEQLLLMVCMQRFGTMNEQRIIDTLLRKELKQLPQPPRWADGSGLSRYNLFTPEDFVFLLNRMRQEFGMERLKHLFPTGNSGTLRKYYTNEEGAIFAKTGTLSGVVALSGYLYTKKNRKLTFSVLVNNHAHTASSVRRSIEKWIRSVRNKL